MKAVTQAANGDGRYVSPDTINTLVAMFTDCFYGAYTPSPFTELPPPHAGARISEGIEAQVAWQSGDDTLVRAVPRANGERNRYSIISQTSCTRRRVDTTRVKTRVIFPAWLNVSATLLLACSFVSVPAVLFLELLIDFCAHKVHSSYTTTMYPSKIENISWTQIVYLQVVHDTPAPSVHSSHCCYFEVYF